MGHNDDGLTGPADRSHCKALGLRIRMLRTARGWTQERLAEESGLHRTFIGLIERGKVAMRIIHLWPLSKALDASICDFFVDEKGRPIR